MRRFAALHSLSATASGHRSARKPCAGPHCRQSVGGRHRFCPFHWRLLPTEMKAALAEAFAAQAWHVFQRLGVEAAALLRARDAERLAAAQVATARLLGEAAD